MQPSRVREAKFRLTGVALEAQTHRFRPRPYRRWSDVSDDPCLVSLVEPATNPSKSIQLDTNHGEESLCKARHSGASFYALLEVLLKFSLAV